MTFSAFAHALAFAPETAVPVAAPEAKMQLDVFALLTHASWPVKATVAMLVFSSVAVWVIAVLKFLQLGRLRASSDDFEKAARKSTSAQSLFALAKTGFDAPGARVVHELAARGTVNIERLRAAADRAIVDERQRARSMMTPLGSIASAAPFIGLFGTVYGIMDAFVRIGAAKSAALPVVAPAIGEALISTAIGLAAAIPAVIFYNAIDKRVGDLVSELEAQASEWVALVADEGTVESEAVPLVSRSNFPRPQGPGGR
jgi:biopolymer transport protein TolQ